MTGACSINSTCAGKLIKLDGTRVALGCKMRCEAHSSCIDHRETVDCIRKQTEKQTLWKSLISELYECLPTPSRTTLSIRCLIIAMTHSLSHINFGTEIQLLKETRGRLFLLARFYLSGMFNVWRNTTYRSFPELAMTEQMVPKTSGEAIVIEESHFFGLALKAQFSDVPFARSLRNRTRVRAAYVEKRNGRRPKN